MGFFIESLDDVPRSDKFLAHFPKGSTRVRFIGKGTCYSRIWSGAGEGAGKRRDRYAFCAILNGSLPATFLDIPPTVFKHIAAWQDFTGKDPGEPQGCDFVVNKSGEGLQTRYIVTPLGEASPIPPTVDVKKLETELLRRVEDIEKYDLDQAKKKGL